MKKYIFAGILLSATQAFAAVDCPAITAAIYNDIPINAPSTPFTINGLSWAMKNDQGRANNATAMSAPDSAQSVACLYNVAAQCCYYTATLNSGVEMTRAFENVGQ
jgi:hypothetical protein